jgi:hypothetical protein
MTTREVITCDSCGEDNVIHYCSDVKITIPAFIGQDDIYKFEHLCLKCRDKLVYFLECFRDDEDK